MGACENYFCHKWQLETLTISLAFGNICGELSGSFPIPSIPTNLVPTYLVTVLNEKLNQAEFIPLFWFWALHFFTINTKHIFPHCFFISWYMFYLFLWVLDFLLWILEGKSQVSDISFSFWGPGLTILHGCGFYVNDICGGFLVILSRNRIHEKTLDFDFRFILCDICHFTFSWYFNDFLENCNRKMFNWRILNFFGFPRLGLIIFPKFTWNAFFIQNHFWHIFFQILYGYLHTWNISAEFCF